MHHVVIVLAAALGIALAGARMVEEGTATPWAPDTPCELPRADRGRAGSAGCLGCHAPSARSGSWFEMTSGGFGHPVEIAYESARLRNPDRYVPASQLPATVPLVDGRVTCTSCHDGGSSLQFRVAASRHRELCLACHRM